MTNLPPQHLLDFSEKTVLVTGSGQGLGAGIALRFAEAGANVVIHYRRSEESAKITAEKIADPLVLQADVTKRADVETLLAEILAKFGKIDVLVNNAGIYPLSTVLEMPESEWDAVIDANLKSVYLCTQVFANQMKTQESRGNIINIASIEAENPAPMHSHYNAAKAGVVMHTRAAANELGAYGIRVNAVSPGLIWREGIEAAWAEGVERYKKAAPLTRLGMPDDIGDACLFLASPAARWITGANLVVDGGVMTKQIF